VASFLFWGMTPLYWSQLHHVPAVDIVAHRVWWSLPVIWLVILHRHKRDGSAATSLFSNRRTVLWSAGAAVLVTGNWLVYVWAVSKGRVFDASLGYYINPLVNVALGTLILKEKLDRMQKIALAVATAGVLYLTFGLGSFPWVSIVLALSFGTYGLIKKQISIGSIDSLALEITLLAPLALIYIGWQETHGGPLIGGGWITAAFLVGAGAVTVFPLLLFGYATRTINLSEIGFFQYIAPTMMLLIGVFALGEPFDILRLPGFLLVWIALVFYTVSAVRKSRKKP
jgi:chloramphenicol-sensitive protein RarD